MNQPTTPNTVEEIRALLTEAYGFKSTSPKAQESINAALDLLDSIADRAQRTPAAPVVAEGLTRYDPALQSSKWDQYSAVMDESECGDYVKFADIAHLLAAHPVAGSPAEADAYARRLAMAIWQKHYSADAPQFALLDDAYGVISQIDNMVTGLARPAAAEPMPASEAAKQTLPQSECNAALRAAPAGQQDSGEGETLDEKALNTLLWFYRRMQNSYGRLPFAEEAIIGLRDRVEAEARAKSAAIPLSQVLSETEIGKIMREWQALSNSRYELCRAVEAEVVSRFRAEGGITNDSTSNLAAPAAPTDAQPDVSVIDYGDVQPTEAWLIEWKGPDGTKYREVLPHNAVGDYRYIDEDASATELVRRTANGAGAQAAQSVRDAAQPIAPGKDKP